MERWQHEGLHCHIADGTDINRVDFRETLEDEIKRYNDLTFNYLDSCKPTHPYHFVQCAHCQTVRSSQFAIYRITPQTNAETYIAIGMSIALETQFGYDIPKIFFTADVRDVPSLLKGYEMIETVNTKERKLRLRKALPVVMQRVQECKWHPRTLPFEMTLPIVQSFSVWKESNSASLANENNDVLSTNTTSQPAFAEEESTNQHFPTENTLTDQFNLVKREEAKGMLRLFSRQRSVSDGFCLVVFRKEEYRGSIVSYDVITEGDLKRRSERLGVRDGDTILRINLGPRPLSMSEKLDTQDGYTRPYTLDLEIAVNDPRNFAQRYLQGSDPVKLARIAIEGYLQRYAIRKRHDELREEMLRDYAEQALGESSNRSFGIQVVAAHKITLYMDSTRRKELEIQQQARLKEADTHDPSPIEQIKLQEEIGTRKNEAVDHIADNSRSVAFHEQLRFERESRFWTLGELAARLGVETKMVSRWERGMTIPFIIHQHKLSEVFGKSLELLGLIEQHNLEEMHEKIDKATLFMNQKEDLGKSYYGLQLNFLSKNVLIDGVSLPKPLSPKAFKFLEFLAARAGRVCQRGEISQAVYNERYIPQRDNARLDALVERTRQQIGDDARPPRFIETVRGIGYRLNEYAGEHS